MSNTPNETQKPANTPANPQQGQQGGDNKQNQGDQKPGSSPQQK